MAIDEDNIKGLLSKWGLAAKPCDSCSSAAALLFCRPHSAFLCLSCDASLHSSANRHARVWMCEVCEQSPAAFTCKADAAALCSSCDRDIHSANPLAHRHHRLPVVPFLHTPPVASPASVNDDESWLIPNLQANNLAGADFVYSSSDADSSFMDSGSLNFGVKNQVDDDMCNNHRSFADSVVPNQTKNTPTFNGFANESCFEIDFTQSKLFPNFNFSSQCVSQTISSSDVGIVPDGNSMMSEASKGGNFDGGATAVQPVPLSRMDREARVMRYREKRKNRKFEKTIRYASRKAYAEARPRIKGRFAKRNNADKELDRIYSSAVTNGFLVDDEVYGVVPSC